MVAFGFVDRERYRRYIDGLILDLTLDKDPKTEIWSYELAILNPEGGPVDGEKVAYWLHLFFGRESHFAAKRNFMLTDEGALHVSVPAMNLWQRLARPATSGAYLPELDSLRALAIGLVFWLHLSTTLHRAGEPSSPLARFSSGGGWGVALFFTISGFVLALPFARHALLGEPAPSLRAYYWRRVRRIEPPYLVALGLAFAAQVLTHRASVTELLPHLLASVFYVHNLVYGTWSSVLPVAWSLEIEAQFYLLAPLLFQVFKIADARSRAVILWLTTIAMFVFSALAHPWLAAHRLDRSFLSDGGFFLLGLALAERFVAGQRPNVSGLWDAAALVLLPIALALWPSGHTLAHAVGALAVVGVFGAAFRGKFGPKMVRWTPATVFRAACAIAST